MAHRWIFAALALATPFAVYWAYRVIARRRGPTPWPMLILWLTGVALAVEALLLFTFLEISRGQGGEYLPPPRDQPAIYDREPPK